MMPQQLLGILGEKISHTLSPRIHNFSASYLKKNCVYEVYDMGSEKLEDFLDSFLERGGIGFNVTTPHKAAVAKLVGGHSLNSINTVFRKNNAWHGASTDITGLEAAIKKLEYSLADFSEIVILGNGGVVRALLDHIQKEFRSFPDVTILRRSDARDAEYLKSYPSLAPRLKSWDLTSFDEALKSGGKKTLVIQASSAPLRGDDLSSLAPAMKTFRGVFVDLVYGQPSALLKVATEKGIPSQDGLPMLIEQARASQQYWWGTSVPYSEILKELKKHR
jgi:shikimate dehydrogenase